MDAIDVLTADHETVRSLFLRFRAASGAEDAAEMKQVTEEAFHELDVHTRIEERVFYPAVEAAGGSELADLTAESNEEHHVVDVLMAELRELEPSDDRFVAKMTVLMENVEHHASEEEKDMFPQVRSLLGEDALADLGGRLLREKQVVKAEMMTLDELRTAAGQLQIDGRSDMSRKQLEMAFVEQFAD